MIDYLKEAIKYEDLREYNKRLRLDELMESLLEEWIIKFFLCIIKF